MGDSVILATCGHRIRLLLAIAGVFIAIFVSLEVSSAYAATSASAMDGDWLSRVNYFREIGGLDPVIEDTTLSNGCWLHARYMAENNWWFHTEDPAKPYYTPEGAAAGSSSDVYLGPEAMVALDGWMMAPFHGIGIIDPGLASVGFGTYKSGSGTTASALDVIRGCTAPTPSRDFVWPCAGAVIPFRSLGGEWPNPLSGTDYVGPNGIPIYLMLYASAESVPAVSSSRITCDGESLAHVVVTGGNYTNPDPSQQSLGRSILSSRRAIVLIPKAPLRDGKTYTVSVTAQGRTLSWSFATTAETIAPHTTSNRVAYYADSATIRLKSTDNAGGSGVAHTYYRLNGAAQVEGTTITRSTAGANTLVYWSVDAAGNIEAPHTVTFTIIAKPSTGGTPSTPASIATLRHGKSFTVYGYIIKHTSGTYPVTLQFYRYQSGHWVLRKSTTAKVSNMLTFSKYSDSTSVPYSGKWRVRARHKVGSKYLYSGYRTFTAS